MTGFNSFYDDIGTKKSVDFLPLVTYDGRSGRMSRRDRENGETHLTDITRTFKAVFDIENIELGYIKFEAGSAPDFRLTRFADNIPVSHPGEGYKKGARFVLKLGKDCGGDIRELAGNSNVFMKAVKKLHSEYLDGVKEHSGKLPVVALKDSYADTVGEGAKRSTNYVPVFEITGWVSRPDDLVYQARSSSSDLPAASTPPATGSTRVSAPSEDDFG